MRFRILGPLEARTGTRPVSIRAAKPRSLLGTLLLSVAVLVPAALTVVATLR